MSRHRAVRNIDLDEELADDDFDGNENPYDDISEEDQFQLEESLTQLVSLIGAAGQESGFTEREMKDALWDSYFDVDPALNALVEERSKRESKERKKAEGEEGDAWTLSALQRLSLQRKGRNGVHLDGNKNAKGIQGLHFGGRAGLAKKNLASLAPEGLPGTGARKYGWNGFESLDVDKMQSSKRNKRLAGQGVEAGGVEVLGAEETPSRPSKLAALAASRGKPSTTTSTPLAPNTSAEGKPLSKLQQKMQANLLARQQKNQPLNQEDLLQRQREEEDERNRLLHLPTGDPIATLFPVASTSGASPDQSSFGFVLRSSKKEDLAVPGGSPFETIMHHLEAFMRPSPDDIVLKAREGTNLAKT